MNPDQSIGADQITKTRRSKFLPQSGAIVRPALKFLKRTMRRYGRPKKIVTDRFRSYSAAMKVIAASNWPTRFELV
jgi:hypothetical protein